MQTNTLSASIDDFQKLVNLIKLSVKCPVCEYSYTVHLSYPEPPYCNDKHCTACGAMFKARFRVSKETCITCNQRVRCIGLPVSEVEEFELYVGLGEINWQSIS